MCGNGLAVIESLLDEGQPRDSQDPKYRRLIADALAQHLQITSAIPSPPALSGGWSIYSTDQLWPPRAHSPMFDFQANAAGAEWIDRIAAQAKPVAAQPGKRMMIGRHDWSAKHFRFQANSIAAVYDWDSLDTGSETVIVGNAAMTFTTRFDLPDLKRWPSPDETRAFIDEYSAARSSPLNRAERQRIAACATLLAAYTARCEHCGYNSYDAENDPNSFTTALRAHGLDYLNP
jgi:hypothetical protein